MAATQGYGARVVLHGTVYDEAMAEALRIQATEGQTLIHPFDDPAIIAGQGTIGLELLEQVPGLDVVVCGVGGGGIISGIALAIKETRPEVRIMGVESAALPAALRAREAGRPVVIPPAETIAEGIAVRKIGETTFAPHRALRGRAGDGERGGDRRAGCCCCWSARRRWRRPACATTRGRGGERAHRGRWRGRTW